ncbi:MAG TPA: SDR family NAD(P)-dependent oxidoreductase, partial [Polyangiales bacterium]
QQLRAPRLTRADGSQQLERPAQNYQLSSLERGRLDRLSLCESARRPLAPGEVRIEVHSAGLNFRDVVVALDLRPSELAAKGSLESPLGSECAGVIIEVGSEVTQLTLGQRVMAIAHGAFGPEAVTDARLAVPIPPALSFAEAATLPIAFATAHYGLHDLAGVRAGERALIHTAAGGVGMAALQLARLAGLEVFATASEPKWSVLQQLGLPPDRIASSRDLGFAQAFTGGVDVVLNSLAREYVDASLGLLGQGGRFLELGKTDVRAPEALRDEHPGVHYRAYDLMELGPDRLGEILRLIGAQLARGEITPLRRQRFPIVEARAAFRLMAQGGHVGKVVIDLQPWPALPQQGSVLISGGLGAIGLASAAWLADHGVRHLVLASRQGEADPRAAEAVALLASKGAQARVVECDVSDRASLERLLSSMPAHAPLRGVVHAAGVLDDALLADQSSERLARVMAPKVAGAWNLHQLTAHLPLDLFVVFSSAAGTAGSAGQSNYAAANAFLDQLCLERRAHGLAALSLAWGAWGDGGLAVKHADLARMDAQGMGVMNAAQGMALFGLALARSAAHQLPWLLKLGRLQQTLAASGSVPALWRQLVQLPSAEPTQRSGLVQGLARLSADARRQRAVQLVCEDAAQVLGLASAEAVAPERPLSQLGLDSLMAVELRNRIAARFECRLPATLLFDHPTPAALGRHLVEQVLALGAEVAAPAERASSATSGDEPIAIVSMACRFPGGISTPEALWDALREGRDLVSKVPVERWDADAIYDPDPDVPGKSYAREGGFVDNIDRFDAAFFEITPREARSMDPQQRLLLETAWEALERAGIVPASLSGSATGVYVGMYDTGYLEGARLEQMDGYLGTGSFSSVASGRIAYTLGLQGPAVTVDTACSSSLVALHLAAQALRAGDCDLALAGGVTLMLSAHGFVEFSRLRGMSPSGRCKSFSDDADGAGWSDGCGLLLLKRLSDARRAGDRVLGVLRASAINQDGRSQGLTAPNGPAQERVVQQALRSAGLTPRDVDYVEAHGTGTTLGDPIEANALAAVFGRTRAGQEPLWVGSLKSNMAHAQAAAGVAGVMKVLLALRHQQLPKTLYADKPTRHVDWAESGLSLLTQARPWPRGARVRRAGVSGFGISGTNAHVILEEAPAYEDESLPAARGDTHEARVFSLSAQNGAALSAQATQLRAYLLRKPEASLDDVAYSLALGRTHFTRRAAVVASSRQELVTRLELVASNTSDAHVLLSPERGPIRGKLAFVFPGHGPQWADMAQSLLASSEVFASALAQCDAALAPHTGWSVLSVLRGEPGAPELTRVDVVQPALFAMMVALSALWRSLGVTPDAVVGHSMGEVAAAYVAGALSLDDAAKVIALRARTTLRAQDRGGMLAVELAADALAPRIRARWGQRLDIGAINSPSSCAVSGELVALEELAAELAREQVFARRVGIRFASHSAQMEELEGEILAQLAAIQGQQSALPMISTVLGRTLAGTELDA